MIHFRHNCRIIITLVLAGLAEGAVAQTPPRGPAPMPGRDGTTRVQTSSLVTDGMEIATWWADWYASREGLSARGREVQDTARRGLADNPAAVGVMVVVERHGVGMQSEHKVYLRGVGDIDDAIVQADGPSMTSGTDVVTERYGVYVARDGRETIVPGKVLADAPATIKAERAERAEKACRIRELEDKADHGTLSDSEKDERKKLWTEAADAQTNAHRSPYYEPSESRPLKANGQPLTDDEMNQWMKSDPMAFVSWTLANFKKSRNNPLSPYIRVRDIRALDRNYDVQFVKYGISLQQRPFVRGDVLARGLTLH